MTDVLHSLLSRRRVLESGLTALAAVTVLGPAMAAGAAETPVAPGAIHVFNWVDYIGSSTLADFTAATGIKTQYDTYTNEDHLFDILSQGNPGYDVVVPSNAETERLIKSGLLLAVDRALIPNTKNIEPALADAAFDPGRAFTTPYFWGTVGVGYSKSRVGTAPESWGDLFTGDAYVGRLALLSDPTTLFPLALKFLGFSANSTVPDELKAAEDLMIKAKPKVKVFAAGEEMDLLKSGDIDVCISVVGDVLKSAEGNPDIAYAIPREGTLLWQDSLVIPKNAPNPKGAQAFINFLLDAKVGASIASTVPYATANAAALALMPAAYRANPALWPSADILGKSELVRYQGDEHEDALAEMMAHVRDA